MKKVVFTCITGNYDAPVLPRKTRFWLYLAFTDNEQMLDKLTQAGWKAQLIDAEGLDPVRLARKVKACPHLYFEYDVCVWIDGNLALEGDVSSLVALVPPEAEIGILTHPIRDCVYQEADACIKLKKDDPELIRRQAQVYRKRSFPEHSGMVTSSVIVRRNTEPVRVFGERWFAEVMRHSRRDQIAWPWIRHHHPVSVQMIPYTEVIGPMMTKAKHLV